MTEVSNHPTRWSKNNTKYYVNENTTKLLIGSMPPKRICDCNLKDGDIDFFYGSKDNRLWKIFFEDLNLTKYQRTKEDCSKFLDDYNIGLFDVVSSCIRNPQNDNSCAADENLLSITPLPLKDFTSILKDIIILYITGEYVLSLLKIFYAEKIEFASKKEITMHEINKLSKHSVIFRKTAAEQLIELKSKFNIPQYIILNLAIKDGIEKLLDTE